MIMKDDEKGKEQNAKGLYENRVINEISVNSQEVFYQDAYDRCVKEVSYNTKKQNVQYSAQKNAVVHYNTAEKPGNRLFLLNKKFF